ncbi:MAG: DUF192 domain-containing protein [Proteobacteria bacterium]|nr:DUF192 domain-containing protein [Pseudomonadota bacterium]
MMMVRVIAILSICCLLSGQSSEGNDLDSAFEKDILIIAASKHACYVFDIYIAMTRAQQSRGLMHVRYMPKFTGMLFVYRQPRVLSMWMKNTYMPLDMLFIRADGSIANIVTNTEPLSLESIHASEPLNFVLELNAGVTERLGIDTQSRVYFSGGSNAKEKM